MKKIELICVVGPTASGKSELAVTLAKKYNGEIISADSRQVYKGMNIGSGKVEGEWKKNVYLYKNIPHYLIDEASPKIQYSAARFQKNCKKIIKEILGRGKIPIICGGTGYWIDTVVNEQVLPQVKPNAKLRKELSKLSTSQLVAKLKKIDPARAKLIDTKNPHRLIRALEIVLTTGKPVPPLTPPSKGGALEFPSPQQGRTREGFYDIIWLGIKPSMSVLEKNITKRLKTRLKLGMLDEVKELHNNGLSWKKLESFGLEYKFCALHLQGKISRQEMENNILFASRQYAKRQLTWWKRNPEIIWSESPKKLLTLAKNKLS